MSKSWQEELDKENQKAPARVYSCEEIAQHLTEQALHNPATFLGYETIEATLV